MVFTSVLFWSISFAAAQDDRDRAIGVSQYDIDRDSNFLLFDQQRRDASK